MANESKIATLAFRGLSDEESDSVDEHGDDEVLEGDELGSDESLEETEGGNE